MKLNKFFFILIMIVFITQIFSESAIAQSLDYKNRLAKENLFLTRTLSDLYSENVMLGDKIALKLLQDIDCGNNIIIPSGSIIEGKAIKSRKSFILRSDAYIDVLITDIKMNSGCNICFENDPIKLRIVDPLYKGFVRKILQRTPSFVSGTATSITLASATNLSNGVIVAITVGAQMVTGFISGLIDPDIDKTRINGAIIRAVEGTPPGAFLLTVEKGYDINSTACCYVAIRVDEETREKILCYMKKVIASSKSF